MTKFAPPIIKSLYGNEADYLKIGSFKARIITLVFVRRVVPKIYYIHTK